jgi:hypothetical protein
MSFETDPHGRNARSGPSSAGGSNLVADPVGPYRLLVDVVEAADRDPVVLVDVALELLGHANRRACAGGCTRSEWVASEFRLARRLVDNIASWKQTSWREVLDALAARLDFHHFEEEVLSDIWRLPQAAEEA